MHVLAIIQGWDQLVSAVLGILGVAVAALGPKLVEAAGAWLDERKPEPATQTIEQRRPNMSTPEQPGDIPPEPAEPTQPTEPTQPVPPDEEPVDPEPEEEHREE